MVGQSFKLRFTLEQAVKDQKGNVVNSPFLRPWVVNATPRPRYPQETPGTHCTESRVGTRAGKHACGKTGVHWDSIPGPSNALRVAISTELSRPKILKVFTVSEMKNKVQRYSACGHPRQKPLNFNCVVPKYLCMSNALT
jgi:hypothetical protein